MKRERAATASLLDANGILGNGAGPWTALDQGPALPRPVPETAGERDPPLTPA
jgi:hypothetical protein